MKIGLIGNGAISAHAREALPYRHEPRERGDFGAFSFSISGQSLPGNPRSSALAAMSVVASILEQARHPVAS